MTQTDNVKTQSNRPVSLTKSMLIGAAIGFIVISFFVFGVDRPHPEWGKLWMIKPLIITPFAGAVGGAFYYFMDYQRSRGFNKIVAVILSLIVFVVGLWLGIVLGLNGTMWD